LPNEVLKLERLRPGSSAPEEEEEEEEVLVCYRKLLKEYQDR
jgi:hypothetical protein